MKRILDRHEIYVLIAIIVFSSLFSIINPRFLSLENFFDLLKGYSLMGIFTLGMLIVIVSGGIDLSFTAIATICGYVNALLLISYGEELNLFIIFLIAAGIGAALGMVNAVIIHKFDIAPIISTIATSNIFFGLLMFISGGKWLQGFPLWFEDFAKIKMQTLYSPEGTPYGLSIVSVIFLMLLVITALILKYTTLGRSIYAMGGDKISAKRAGINVFGIHVFVYSFMGLVAGIGGVVQLLLVNASAPNSLVGKELDVIAAVVIGGANLAGGVGTILGTLLGVILIAIMGNGLTLMRVPSIYINIIIGFLILISIGASTYRRKKTKRQRIITENN